MRENTEGLFSTRQNLLPKGADQVTDTLRVSRHGSERLFRAAFQQARRRRKKITLADKSNVLPSMVFFRRIFEEIGEEYPDIHRESVYVDAACLHLVRRPESFDVLVTENLFGDILSDLAAALVGGMGLAPSADIGDRHGLFQPAHGSAPDIAGQSGANPTAMILSVAMMLEWLGHPETIRGARLIQMAVEKVLGSGNVATPDLGGRFSTRALGAAMAEALSQ